MIDTLETERLVLRPLELSDCGEIYAKWAGDPRVNRFMLYPLYKSAEDGIEWLKSVNLDDRRMDYGFVLKKSGELIGSGGIYYHDDKDIWHIGYNLAYDFWGKGYATEAVSRIVEYARSRFAIGAIHGTFAVDNIGSRRVMEKLGMTYLEDTEYTKSDGSVTFKAKTFRKVFAESTAR